MKTDGDLRMLGAADGYAHALIHLRSNVINPIDGHYSPGIHPRHTRKIAAKAAKLAPLRELEKWLVCRHQETRAAYDATRKEIPTPKRDEGEYDHRTVNTPTSFFNPVL